MGLRGQTLHQHLARQAAERCFCGTLTCGLGVCVLRKPGFRQKTALLTVDFGSLDLALDVPGGRGRRVLPAGTAHFLEHRMFEKDGGDITELFGQLGAEVDASTAFTATTFQFTCSDFFAPNLELLLRLCFAPHLTAEGVAREREVIARELQLYGDSLEWVAFLNGLDSVYPGHPLGMDIAGTPESLAAIDLEVLRTCHRHFYHPANATLLVCGDVEPQQVADLVDGWLARERIGAGAQPARPRRLPPAQARPVRRRAVLPVVQPHLLLVWRDQRQGLRGRPLLRRELALELALDGLFGWSSRFFEEAYRTGLIDASAFGFEVNAETTFCACLLGGDTRHPRRLEEAVAAELEQGRSNGLLEGEFGRIRRKAYGHLLQTFDQVESCTNMLQAAVTCGAGPFDYLAAYEELTVDDVIDCLKTCLDPGRYGVSAVDPAPTRDRP
ncbi:MAG: pitrilysin family protein [Candidatus Latescibacterota bacterium]